MVEDRKYLRRPVARGHVLGYLFLSGRVIDMAIGIDNFHDSLAFFIAGRNRAPALPCFSLP